MCVSLIRLMKQKFKTAGDLLFSIWKSSRLKCKLSDLSEIFRWNKSSTCFLYGEHSSVVGIDDDKVLTVDRVVFLCVHVMDECSPNLSDEQYFGWFEIVQRESLKLFLEHGHIVFICELIVSDCNLRKD